MAAGRDRGLMQGIPVGVKDNCYTKGILTEVGSKAMEGFVPDYDSTVVANLYAAGAVLIGKTRCHEWSCGGSEPPTRSAWDRDRFPGGSSIGSGVALSARSAFGAIGTDTGGSIRIPATLNNLVGMKATYGRVSAYGVLPLAWSLDHVGPLTRTARDNAIMLGAMAGHDAKDANSARVELPDFTAAIDGGVQGLRIGIDRDYFLYPGVVDSVRAVTEAVIDELAALGANIIEVSLPELESTRETLMTIRMVESASYHRHRIREKGHLYSPGTRATLQMGEVILATQYVAALRARERFRSRYEESIPARASAGADIADDSGVGAIAGGCLAAARRHGERRNPNRRIRSSCLPSQSERAAGDQRARRIQSRGSAHWLSVDGAAI